MKKVEKKLQAWHVANIPNKAFKYDVKDVEQAVAVLSALADYDLFVGDDCKKTLGARSKMRKDLAKKYKVSSIMLNKYEEYLANMNGGVPCVVSNARGLEEWDEEEGEWFEWNDGEYDLSELMREESVKNSILEDVRNLFLNFKGTQEELLNSADLAGMIASYNMASHNTQAKMVDNIFVIIDSEGNEYELYRIDY